MAAGDYSVRIPPQRKDGKKDEMEVLYEDFNSMAQQLGEKKILREDFLSNVSHEFKTPLSVINNYVTILQSGTLSEAESREYLERVRLSSLQLSDMVGNILQISRLENGKITAKKEDYDLSEQLAETVLGFDRKLTENEIDLEADWDDEIGIFSDPGLLQIVWNNLLSNAVKFTPRGGSVRIAAERDGSGARVSFSDSGCGIAEQDINRIFEKFYQADSSRRTKGNGLGLAMVKEILDLLGCRIEIQSRIGQGSVFTIWIP